MTFERKDLSNDRLIQFYRNLLARMIEEKNACVITPGKDIQMV